MSDTDKDKPDWVAAEVWEPVHYDCTHDVPRRRWQRRIGPVRDCDLPERPTRIRPERLSWRTYRNPGCTWAPVEPHGRRPWYQTAPGWYRDHVWLQPERALVRVQLRRAVTEHRATGEVDVVPSVRQHRHNAPRLYW